MVFLGKLTLLSMLRFWGLLSTSPAQSLSRFSSLISASSLSPDPSEEAKSTLGNYFSLSASSYSSFFSDLMSLFSSSLETASDKFLLLYCLSGLIGIMPPFSLSISIIYNRSYTLCYLASIFSLSLLSFRSNMSSFMFSSCYFWYLILARIWYFVDGFILFFIPLQCPSSSPSRSVLIYWCFVFFIMPNTLVTSYFILCLCVWDS